MTVKVYRIVVGSVVLLLVDLIWVSSSEMTEYLYKDQNYRKPFFATYAKTSMFVIYLFGFIVCKSWRDQLMQLTRGSKSSCNESHPQSNCNSLMASSVTPLYSVLDTNDEEEGDDLIHNNSINSNNTCEAVLSEPTWVPIKFSDNHSDITSEKSSGTESDGERAHIRRNAPTSASASASVNNVQKSVRFSKLTEVRQLSDMNAEEALFARLSYQATLRAQESAYLSDRSANKLSIKDTIKLSFCFCMLWFAGNLSYQIALKYSEAAFVNILSSTSSLFTLAMSAIFPSNSTSDRFSLTKLIAVIISVGSVAIISTVESRTDSSGNYLPIGALWALSGAFFYASYIVLLRHEVNNEDTIDIPMFFGFVGLFSFILLWPTFFILHYSSLETFQWPNTEQWCLILVNGLIGTVLSELLWLWGCFLTSSLLASLSISLTIPLTIMFDVFLKGLNYPRLFLVGTVPLFLSFFLITFLSHYDNFDPIASMLMKLVRHSVMRRPLVRVRDALYSEQTQSLINETA